MVVEDKVHPDCKGGETAGAQGGTQEMPYLWECKTKSIKETENA